MNNLDRLAGDRLVGNRDQHAVRHHRRIQRNHGVVGHIDVEQIAPRLVAPVLQHVAHDSDANARIEAPIDGFVTKKNVNVGASVGPQMPAFTVQDLATLKLESSVDAASIVRLARGKPVEIKVDALPGDVFPGRVEILSPALDPVSRRAAIEIAVDNRGGKLLPHMFARADATVGQLSKVLAIPRDAVLETGAGAVVYRVVRAKGSEVQPAGEFKVEAVHPKVGPSDGELVSIIDGLAEGAEVARTGLGNLSDGAAVKRLATLMASQTLRTHPVETQRPSWPLRFHRRGGRPRSLRRSRPAGTGGAEKDRAVFRIGGEVGGVIDGGGEGFY